MLSTVFDWSEDELWKLAGSLEPCRGLLEPAQLPAWLALPDRRAVNRVRVMMLFSAPLLFKAFEVQVLLQLKRQVFL